MRIEIQATSALLALLLAGPVIAVSLNPKGLGQVLIYPYYTVNKGQDTLLSIVNTDSVDKAVKVRFREGYNGRVVLEFNLFLGGADSWAASISATVSGGARISTPDRSCVEGISGWPQPFVSTGYAGDSADPGPQDIGRTREGMIEVLALGDVKQDSATHRAIWHAYGNAGSCDIPVAFHEDLTVAGNGLMGSGTIVDVGEGTFYAYDAVALSGFAHAPLIDAPHASPDLADARSKQSRFPNGAIATIYGPDGEPMRIDYPRGIDAVSAVFMASSIRNEFLTSPALGATTDWVVTFPTRQFYVDKALYPGEDTKPFEEPFGLPQYVTAPTQAGSRTTWATSGAWNGEGDRAWGRVSCPPLYPCNIPVANLRFQTSVMTFLPPESATRSAVFGSQLAVSPLIRGQADSSYWMTTDSGWMELDVGLYDWPGDHQLDGGVDTANTNVALIGLPVTGFMVYNVVNSNVSGGRLANYGGAFAHRMSAPTCEQGNGENCPTQ